MRLKYNNDLFGINNNPLLCIIWKHYYNLKIISCVFKLFQNMYMNVCRYEVYEHFIHSIYL